jgi:hypothetical protein
MDNKVNTNVNTCFSYTAITADNINSGCDAAFTATNTGPGIFQGTQVAKITLTNSGSIDASKLYLYASQVNGKLATGLTNGLINITSLALSAPGLEGTIASGNQVVVSYGGHTQTFIAGAAAAGGAASITVNSATAAFDFPIGSTVSTLQSNSSLGVTNCYDTKTLVGGTAGATYGNQLNFVSTAGNPLCGAVLMWVQEVSGANTYCWFGKGSTLSVGSPPAGYTQDPNGRCLAPIYSTTSGISSTISSIPLTLGTALNGNVAIGDQILVSQGNHTQTFTAATTSETYGASSIAVTPGSIVGSPFTTGATITNLTAQISLNSAANTDNISTFQTAHRLSSGKVELFPINGNASIDQASGAPELVHNTSRTFYVGLYLPVPGGSNQNPLQGLASTFGLTWHIDQ